MYIGHELHFYSYLTIALTGFTTATIYVKRKMLGFISPYRGQLLSCKKMANIIESFYIGNRIRSAGPTNRVLVDEFHTLYLIDVSLQIGVLSRFLTGIS